MIVPAENKFIQTTVDSTEIDNVKPIDASCSGDPTNPFVPSNRKVYNTTRSHSYAKAFNPLIVHARPSQHATSLTSPFFSHVPCN